MVIYKEKQTNSRELFELSLTLLNSWEYLYRETKSVVVTCDYNYNRNWSVESRTPLKLSGQIFSNSKKDKTKEQLMALKPMHMSPQYPTILS